MILLDSAQNSSGKLRSELEAPLEVRFAFKLCLDVYCVRVFIEKLLAVGIKLKQLVLDAANVLEVLVVALGSRWRHFAWVDLAVVSFIVKITFKVKSGTNAAVKPNVKSPCKKDLILGGKRNEIYP